MIRVEPGQAFVAYVVMETDAPSVGVRTDISFDPRLLHVVGIDRGTALAKALFSHGTTADCSWASLNSTMVVANETGHIRNLLSVMPPSAGAIEAGTTIAYRLTMEAQPAATGPTTISLEAAGVRDSQKRWKDVAGSAAAVTIAAATTPSGSAQPSGSAGASQPSLSGGAGAPPPPASPGPAQIRLDPADTVASNCEEAKIALWLKTDAPTSGVVADIGFTPAALRITKIEPGPAFEHAQLSVGTGGQTLDEAIAQANSTGLLSQLSLTLLPGSPDLPSGDLLVATITATGKTDGPANVTVTSPVVLDANLGFMQVLQPTPPPDQALPGAETPVPPVEIGPRTRWSIILALIAVSLFVVIVVRRRTYPGARLRRWPYYASLLMGLIPVAIFVGLIALLVVRAAPVLRTPGLAAIFSTKFSSVFSLGGVTGDYGLVPAVWGTIEITLIAVVIALPVSLALAIVATEFPMGPLGRVVRPLLGVLSGVPPIVYAIAGAIFVTTFIAPKFAGSADFNAFDPTVLGVPRDQWPPADVPWNPTAFAWPPNVGGIPSSTLLGGVLIALLVIPFMSPLIVDAMRNVPSAAREASLALGANRGYTLRRVILPIAMPGIVAAVALAVLKAFGDVLIIALAVGWQAETLPNPIADVLERTSSLAAEGANLLGNLQASAGQYCDPKTPACVVGYTSALLLLIVAAVVVISASVIEGRLRRRLRA
jgi:ABC-type phosphate transport system permease subunit